MTIREFNTNDVSAICELLNVELGYSITESMLTSTTSKMQQDNNYIIFVAECNKSVVGFIGLHIGLAFEFSESIIRIIALAVKKKYQQQSIGTNLIRTAKRYAAEHNAAFITVNSGMQRTKAHSFYENNGFYKKGYSFGKII